MRRKDREVTDRKRIEEIICKADVIRIGLFDGHEPYIVPLNFGWKTDNKTDIFYMHCALEGRKVEILKKHPHVCFEMDIDHELVKGMRDCSWSMKYKSVMGTGIVSVLEDEAERSLGLTEIMGHYNNQEQTLPYDFSKYFDKTLVLKLVVESISCKVKD